VDVITFYDSSTVTQAFDDFKSESMLRDRSKALPYVAIEIIDSCSKSLYTGKACGPDDLSAEHLIHAHPSLFVHLKFLSNAIFSDGYVPNGFGRLSNHCSSYHR
jgi:hypothetical protein